MIYKVDLEREKEKQPPEVILIEALLFSDGEIYVNGKRIGTAGEFPFWGRLSV